MTEYDKYPTHPLNGVPQEILDAARECLDDAVLWKDVHPDHAHPLADAVVISLRPWLSWDERPTQRYTARFVPQAWIKDVAFDIDPLGDAEWDCTQAIREMDDSYREDLLNAIALDGYEALDDEDYLMGDPNAPEWVRNHQGPFSIWIRESKES